MAGDGQGKSAICIEFVVRGGLVKVAAIDAATGAEDTPAVRVPCRNPQDF